VLRDRRRRSARGCVRRWDPTSRVRRRHADRRVRGTTAKVRASAMLAGIAHAGGERFGLPRGLRLPLSRWTYISKVTCATSRTRRAFRASTRRRIRWTADGERALRLVFVTQESGTGTIRSTGCQADLADQRLFAPPSGSRVTGRSCWKIYRGLSHQVDASRELLPYGLRNLSDRPVRRHSRVTYPFQRIKKLAKVPPQHAGSKAC